MKLNPLEVLAAWGTEDVARKDQLLTMAIAAVLVTLGETSIQISQDDIANVMLSKNVERTMAEDGRSVIVHVRPK
jgi:hypothetical protein